MVELSLAIAWYDANTFPLERARYLQRRSNYGRRPKPLTSTEAPAGAGSGNEPGSASIGVPVATPLPGGVNNPSAQNPAGSGGGATASALATTGAEPGELVLFAFTLLLAGAMFVLYVHRDEAER